MPSLILKTRLEVLRSNLRDVKDVMELAKRRSQEIEDLRNILFGLGGVRELAKRMNKAIGKSKIELDDEELQSNESLANAMGELKYAEADLGKLLAKLETCERSLDMLLGSRVELAALRIQERLPDRAEQGIRNVQSLLADASLHPTAWEAEQRLTMESEPLFAEYVDLLRGLALRETGIERGICELADRLLAGCDRVAGAPWKSLAIPSHRGPSELTPAQIIRLGFPEWTIWALPLAAYEFGRIMVNQDAGLRKRVEEGVAKGYEPKSVLIDSLADAFATYAVGPAYGCAAILMRLNPRPAMSGGPPIDGTRAQMIFELLKHADDSAGLTVSFANLRAQLESGWSEAVQEAGAVRTDSPAANELAEFFWKWAELNYITAKYQPTAWQKAEALKTLLPKRISREPLTPEDQLTIDSGVGDVRDMLNAVWLCRLNRSADTEHVAREAEELWQKTHFRQQKVSRFAPPAQRSGRTS